MKWLCISTDWFFRSCPTVWLRCVTEVCLLTLSLFSISFVLFYYFFLLLSMAALVNSALSVAPIPFSSDSCLWENGSMCFNMLFLLLMWIKAPAKQLAQSSALASLTGLSEYPFFCHWWEGKGREISLIYSRNVGKAVGTKRDTQYFTATI